MWSTSTWLSAGLLIAAGVYQWSSRKGACLHHCRTPAHFLSENWHPGSVGAFRMGIHHGYFCLGCCWLLMALLFVGGVMNLVWVVALAMLVLLEKLAPQGHWMACTSGAAMILGGLYVAAVGR